MRGYRPPWLLLTNVDPIPGSEMQDPIVDGLNATIQDSATDSVTPALAINSEQSQSTPPRSAGSTLHLNHLRFLQRNQPPRTILEKFGSSYQDFLQAPLQPLTHNLDSVTYEVFEKDPVKYNQYYAAIRRALLDWRSQKKAASGPDGKIVIAVVGAGRGPLVSRALQASDSTNIPIELWAIEKNPNAFVLLQRHNETTWNNRVILVKSDMRSWKGPHPSTPNENTKPHSAPWPIQDSNSSTSHVRPPTYHSQKNTSSKTSTAQTHYPIDIVISELLGSFGDNELSPECLDGMTPLLNPTHGISIPSSYTAYLTPIAAPKLHTDISGRAPTNPEAANTPYVVMLHAMDYLSTKSQAPQPSNQAHSNAEFKVVDTVPNVLKAWSFQHGPLPKPYPVENENMHNTRQARLTFDLRNRAVCHGIAGYFEAELYPGVELSTNPLTMEEKSPLMMSWFPIFFPLKVRKSLIAPW